MSRAPTRRRLRFWLIALWLCATAASQVVVWTGRARRLEALPRLRLDLPASEEGRGRAVHLAFLRWTPEDPDSGLAPPPSPESEAARRPAALLLHGSPGSADNFRRVAPLLARAGRQVVALDLPGFGASQATGRYSIEANARVALRAMDALGLQRAHVVGFSLGGGAALWMAELAPQRVASLTLLSSVGVQEAEGSGSYAFEHFKYALGFPFIGGLPELLPHFGLLGSLPARWAFLRSFWDTDQRPLRSVMTSLTQPALIVHGGSDPLVPAWAARLHHQLIPTSSLVMLDASHFFVFLKPRLTAAVLTPFFARHDDPQAPPLRSVADFAPAAGGEAELGPFHINHGAPWWVVVALIILATFISEDITVITVGLLVARGQIDWSVGLIGCYLGIVLGDGALWAIGRFVGRPALRWPLLRRILPEKALDRWGRWFDRHSVAAVFLTRAIPGTRLPTYLAAGLLSRRTRLFLFWAACAALLWTPLLFTLSLLLGAPLLRAFERVFGGWLSVLVALLVVAALVRVVMYSTTWVGRRRLAVDLLRLVKPEFWPPWLFYLPLVPWLLWLGIRRGFMTFTCANPGIAHGGGVVGESKAAILEGLRDADQWVVPTELIDEGEAKERAERAIGLIESDERFGGYPVVLKPDASQRGHGLRVARSPDDVRAYFEEMTRPALLQRFHPGPCEAGVLWARRIRSVEEDPAQTPGFVFSITRKVFPFVVGDGRRTLEQLVWSHPRCRMQADVFLKRHADKVDVVLARGERLQLAQAGNHAQGTMFLDGADLLTPALERRFEAIAQSFVHAAARGDCRHALREGDSGFDFGRFDIRYESDEALKRGEGFAIVELNGTMSESTNLYDPRKGPIWMYRTLFSQWALLYRIGAARRRTGVRPMRLAELLAAVRDHYHGRPGSKIAD